MADQLQAITPKEALDTLSSAVKLLKLTYQEHGVLDERIKVLEEYIKATSKAAVKKAVNDE